jgi:putative ABC transport system permease protein
MLKSYIKIAWRNIARHKMHTTINIVGLALGMMCCLFIFLWVEDERNMDHFHADQKNLYSVYQTITANGKVSGTYNSPFTVAGNNANFPLEDLPAAVPEVKRVCFYATGYELPWGHPESFQVGEKIIRLKGSRASNNFFRLFSYPLIQGTSESALQDIHSIAISRKMAELFFESPAAAIGSSCTKLPAVRFSAALGRAKKSTAGIFFHREGNICGA